MLKAVIFDMDGLMLDSEKETFIAFQEVLVQYNETMDLEFYKTMLGKPERDNVSKLQERYPSLDILKLFEETYKHLEIKFSEECIPLKKGLIDLLQFLKENNIKTMIATSSLRVRLNRIIKQANIEKYFNDTISGDEVTFGKPNPEIFLTACSRLGVDPTEAIVLEDSMAGITAAYDGGIPVINIPDLMQPTQEFIDKTISVEKDLHAVIEYIKNSALH